MARFTQKIVSAIQASALTPLRLRRRLLQLYGMDCDRTARVYEHNFFGSNKVRLDEGCFVSVGCHFDGSDHITIGAGASLGPRVVLITSKHDIGPPGRRAGPLATAPIVIGRGCWIGGGATVLPGVTVAQGCVVAAGAIVTKSTEPNGVYVGVPARRRSDLPPGPSLSVAQA